MTHSELVQRAAKWLQKKHPIVITEMASGAAEVPDGIGFKGHISTLVECKVSRADFFANKTKPERGLGYYRYFMTPRDLVKCEELPAGWGLLEVDGRSVWQLVDSEPQYDRDLSGELSLLVSTIRRIGQTLPTGVSVKCYTITTKNRATLGIEKVES